MTIRSLFASVKSLKFLLIVLIVSLVVSASVVANRYIPADWVINLSRDAGIVLAQIRVTGHSRTGYDEVVETLDIEDGTPLLSVDLVDLRAKVETLQWVKTATVSRHFPNEIGVEIKEREPFALWQLNGTVQLIDPDGVIITDKDLEAFANLLLLVGQGAPEAATDLSAILKVAPVLASRVVSAVRFGERRWDVILDSGVRVKLPAWDSGYGPIDAWKTLENLEANEQILSRDLLVIDLRIADRLVVRLSPDGQKAIKRNVKNYGT